MDNRLEQGAPLLPCRAIAAPGLRVIGVDLHQGAVGAGEGGDAHRRDLPVGRVVDRDERNRVALSQIAEDRLQSHGIAIQIGDHEDERARGQTRGRAPQRAAETVDGGIQLGTGHGEGAQQLPERAATARGTKVLESGRWVAEDQTADPVVEPTGRPADQGRRTGRLHRLEGPARTEGHMRTLVDTEHHRAFALLAEDLHVRLVGAGRHLPIHVADVVALAILAHLLEVDPGAAEDRGIESGEGRVDQMMGGQPERMGLMAQLQQVVETGIEAHRTATDVRGWPPGSGVG